MEDENKIIIEMIRDDIKDIKKDVKSLVALKYKVYGWIAGVSIATSFLSTYIFGKLI